jgi:hypothetical protein
MGRKLRHVTMNDGDSVARIAGNMDLVTALPRWREKFIYLR